MRNTTKGFANVIIIIGVIAVIAVLGFSFKSKIFHNQDINKDTNNGGEKVACTLEAKICPDGSAVGRTGPNCEFAECPKIPAPAKTGGQGILPYNSGIRGTVMLGPTCPVMRNPPDPNCADKPYKTMVVVFKASDPAHPFIITQSNAEGKFEASVPPGEYTLGAGESNLPRCDHPAVTVKANGYTSALISCDTGIR